MIDTTQPTVLLFGVSNKRSIAWAVAQLLIKQGAKVIYNARSQEKAEQLKALVGNDASFVFSNAEDKALLASLTQQVRNLGVTQLSGMLHSIAFANYSQGWVPFHETNRDDFLQATQISCFSLVEIANALKPLLHPQASVVTMGISSQVAAENYGYMSPIKAALESSVRFLAKSFSADTQVRFNCVNAGPVKTASSAGIPGFLDNYLYAEKLTLRKQALTVQEIAQTALFLLSPNSSGINGQAITVDAGMGINYFDQEVVRSATRNS